MAQLYRPRPTSPFTVYEIAGEERQVWTTFTSEQVDINVQTETGWAYLISVLDRFAEGGVDLVRLDAVGYAIKKLGTSSFMIPETYEFIERITAACRERSMGVLVEIHSHYRQQIEIASQVDRVYDFALPPLVLHALHGGDARPLRRLFDVATRNCVTVLDTHDDIGIVDVAPEGDLAGLREPAELALRAVRRDLCFARQQAHELALRWSTADRTLAARIDLASRSFELNLDGELLTEPRDFDRQQRAPSWDRRR